MNKISPFLWFNDNAEEAVEFYVSVFPDSRRISEMRQPKSGLGQVGSVVLVSLELSGQQVTFLNGGPAHQLTEAFSFSVQCETQAEIDDYWARLGEGGTELRCGWIRDRFGLCWQIVPARLGELLKKPGAMQAMMKMTKLDIAVLEAAKPA